MAQADRIHTSPRPEPEVLAAQMRAVIESRIEAMIAYLDVLDDDPDLELVSEDEGGECNDEGFDSDREPNLGWIEKHSQSRDDGSVVIGRHGVGAIFEFGGATFDEELV
ncbi:MAG: hypothetical protein HY859_09605 [Caulobacterales bacterium]|nr:hypothetical protein [Caulobacterales bacterium]